MQITKRDPLTGLTNTLDLPVTQAQLDAWKGGTLIQNAMPQLNADQREFLMTGYMPDSFDEACRRIEAAWGGPEGDDQ